MTWNVYLVCCFLVYVEAKLQISVNDKGAQVSGITYHIITDSEMYEYGLKERTLKYGAGIILKETPEHAYLKSGSGSSDDNDLYKKFRWPQAATTFTAADTEVTISESRPVMISEQVYKNKLSTPVSFTANMHQTVRQEAEFTWSSSRNVGMNAKISYEFGVVGAEISLSGTVSWGQDKTESETTELGTESGLRFDLGPGQSAKAILTATRNEMHCRIFYEITFVGLVAVTYSYPYKGHYFYGLDILEVMESAGLPRTYNETGDIDIALVTGAYLSVEPL